MEKCYTVAETVKMTGVKSYVLRYWEDELDLHLGRNELGHRYYTGEDIQLFLNIKELKNRGLQLRAIHDRLITQELHAKKEGEDRWRSLDETIRRQQSARKEAAAALDKRGKKKSKAHK